MVGCFPGMHKVVGSVPSTVRRRDESRIEVEGRRGQGRQEKKRLGLGTFLYLPPSRTVGSQTSIPSYFLSSRNSIDLEQNMTRHLNLFDEDKQRRAEMEAPCPDTH